MLVEKGSYMYSRVKRGNSYGTFGLLQQNDIDLRIEFSDELRILYSV